MAFNMINDFSKVSLGFAEFVSQLIHETFDAILDSQNYQIDKYLGLEKALNTSNTEFADKYLSVEEINEHVIYEVGFELKNNTILTSEQIVILSNILAKIESNEIVKSKLTKVQFELIYNYLLEILINDKKSKIQMFVERPELARLFVDSGEIKAKLNLSFLNEEIKPIANSVNDKITNAKLKKVTKPINDKISFEVKKLDFSKIQILGKSTNLVAREIIDIETGLKTILIDKESIKSKELNFNIPTTRIIASPINSTSPVTISSEVTIKFRSI